MASWIPQLRALLEAEGLVDGPFEVASLTGGVSSDILRVTTADGRVYCAKRALASLKVAQDWRAPVERNQFEAAWFRTVAGILPDAVPAVLAEDRDAGLFVMEYLDGETHDLWKAQLLAGVVDVETARNVGRTLGRIHAHTAHDEAIALAFPTDDLFDDLRLDPYLRELGRRDVALAGAIDDLIRRVTSRPIALVHGDVSPKNLMIRRGDKQPVFLDAECAWYGHPAFDVAFCLNHLLLKTMRRPRDRATLRQAFGALWESWLEATAFDEDILAVAGALLPALFLARVDGKSPVEYLDDETAKNAVRALARPHVLQPLEYPTDLADEVADWANTKGRDA